MILLLRVKKNGFAEKIYSKNQWKSLRKILLPPKIECTSSEVKFMLAARTVS